MLFSKTSIEMYNEALLELLYNLRMDQKKYLEVNENEDYKKNDQK